MEIFQTFAEISIGILGFTAIVIMFKTEHSEWNHSIFQGMFSHCIQALIYSILPFILFAFECSDRNVWIICSLVLGIFTFTQGIMVQLLDKESKKNIKIFMLFCTTILLALMILNVFEIGMKTGRGPYIIGITWHIFQSLLIFTMIVNKGSKKTPTQNS